MPRDPCLEGAERFPQRPSRQDSRGNHMLRMRLRKGKRCARLAVMSELKLRPPKRPAEDARSEIGIGFAPTCEEESAPPSRCRPSGPQGHPDCKRRRRKKRGSSDP